MSIHHDNRRQSNRRFPLRCGSLGRLSCLPLIMQFSLVAAFLLLMAAMCSAHTPFTGTPVAIPGTINAVDYDKGTQGDAYNIQQPASSGVYRT
ncbi:MAG: hypothetical protein ACRYFS_07240, partial [Janthinobacterium lividum]